MNCIKQIKIEYRQVSMVAKNPPSAPLKLAKISSIRGGMTRNLAITTPRWRCVVIASEESKFCRKCFTPQRHTLL